MLLPMLVMYGAGMFFILYVAVGGLAWILDRLFPPPTSPSGRSPWWAAILVGVFVWACLAGLGLWAVRHYQ